MACVSPHRLPDNKDQQLPERDEVLLQTRCLATRTFPSQEDTELGGTLNERQPGKRKVPPH